MHATTCITTFFFQAGQPRSWFNTYGHLLQLETPDTQRAKDFADVYVQLIADENCLDESLLAGAGGWAGPEGEERIPTLHAVADLVGIFSVLSSGFIFEQRTCK